MKNDLDFNPQQIKNQIEVLHQKLNDPNSNNLVEELAYMQLALKHLLLKIKNIDNKLKLQDLSFTGLFSKTEAANNLTIDAEFPLSPTQGFYELEYDSRGRSIRWTGPGKIFYFDLYFDRTTPTELILKLTNSLLQVNIEQIHCFVDGSEVLLEQEREEDLFYLKAHLPKIKDFSRTKISFLVPNPIKASDINSDSQDRRKLGVAFSQLVIRPLLG